MTGTAWIEDYGLLVYPITITNTNSVGTVRDAVIEWGRTRLADDFYCCLPVVAETWDGDLSDIYGFHVTKAHTFRALESAKPGPVRGRERRRRDRDDLPRLQGRDRYGEPEAHRPGWRVHRRRTGPVQLRPAATAPHRRGAGGAGDHRAAGLLRGTPAATPPAPPSAARRGAGHEDQGSIIVVVATDAPLLPHQLRRVARRASLGIGRMGGIAGSSSGDLFIAFSTASVGTPGDRGVRAVGMLGEERITRCTRPRCRRRRRRSSTPCWRRRRCEGPTTTSFRHCRTTGFGR